MCLEPLTPAEQKAILAVAEYLSNEPSALAGRRFMRQNPVTQLLMH